MSKFDSTIHQQLLTTADAAKWLGVSARTIANWVNSGQLKALRFGNGRRRAVRFEASDVEGFIAAHRTRSEPAGGTGEPTSILSPPE